MSNGLDPDQDAHSVGPDLGPNSLQRLSPDDKSRRLTKQGKSKLGVNCLFDFKLRGKILIAQYMNVS